MKSSPPGANYKVAGAAWTAEAEIVKVELSTDGGSSWEAASLGKEKARNSWQLWEYDWNVPPAGALVFCSRARPIPAAGLSRWSAIPIAAATRSTTACRSR